MFWIPKKYKNRIAWSNYLKTYIRVESYLTKSHWWFVRCDENGVWKDSKIMKAGSKVDVFKWVHIK